jgi:hypothetical protein
MDSRWLCREIPRATVRNEVFPFSSRIGNEYTGRVPWSTTATKGNAGSTRAVSERCAGVSCGGRWCLIRICPRPSVSELKMVSPPDAQLSAWDTGFRLLGLCSPLHRARGRDQKGLPKGVRHLLAMAAAVPEQKVVKRGSAGQSLFFQVGAATVAFFRGAPEMLHFLGEITLSFGRLFRGRSRFRLSDLWWEIEEVGPRALGIVSVISFLVGLFCLSGADQLRLVGRSSYRPGTSAWCARWGAHDRNHHRGPPRGLCGPVGHDATRRSTPSRPWAFRRLIFWCCPGYWP